MAGIIPPGLPYANEFSVILSALSAADRASINELSVPDMRAWSAARAEEYRQLILSIHALHNILAPIHRLPPELLSKIFVEAWQDRRSIRLAHVCQLWRSLLLAISQFWAVAAAQEEFRLSSDDKFVFDEDYLEVVCSRSAPRNISLHLSSISPRGHLQLIQHAGRITSMQVLVRGCHQLERLWQALHTGMPRLEDLVIRADASTRGAKGLNRLSTNNVPLLIRLTVPTRLFPYHWPNTLQDVSLQGDNEEAVSHTSFVTSLAQVLKSLEGYSVLTALSISDHVIFHSTNSRPPSRAFPALERLRIQSKPETVSALLSLLSFPPSVHVDVQIIASHLPHDDLFIPGSALDAVVAAVDRITVQIGPQTLFRGYTDGHERFRINFNDQLSSAHGESLIRLFTRTSAPISHLRLTEALSVPSRVEFTPRWRMFTVFLHITHLSIHSHVAQFVLQALNPSHALAGGSALLPSLWDLTVGFATHRGGLIAMSLRRGEITPPIARLLRGCCRMLSEILAERNARGCRLSRVEFFWYEDGCMDEDAPLNSRIDLAELNRESVEDGLGLKSLREAVEGPVVFAGYRFLPDEEG